MWTGKGTEPLFGEVPDDPELADLVREWPRLPEHIRLAIRALLSTTKPV